MEAAQLLVEAITAICAVSVAVAIAVLTFRVGRRAVNNI